MVNHDVDALAQEGAQAAVQAARDASKAIRLERSVDQAYEMKGHGFEGTGFTNDPLGVSGFQRELDDEKVITADSVDVIVIYI